MRKTILLMALLLFMPAFATTYTIDTDLLGNATSYDAYPGDIYVILMENKTVTIVSHAGQLNLVQTIEPGESYTNVPLNLTVLASQCVNQTIAVNVTGYCPNLTCGDCRCSYISNITSDAEILAYRYKYESCNDSLIKCYENQARCDNRTMGYMTQIDNANNMASVKFEEGKRTQAQLDFSGGVTIMAVVLILLAVIVLALALSFKMGWIKLRKTMIHEIVDQNTIDTQVEPYNYPIGEIGKNTFTVGGKKKSMSNLIAFNDGKDEKVAIFARPEMQEELSLPTKIAMEERELFKEVAKKKDKKLGKIEKRLIDKEVDDGIKSHISKKKDEEE